MMTTKEKLIWYAKRLNEEAFRKYGRHIPEYTGIVENIMQWRISENVLASLICHTDFGPEAVMRYTGSVMCKNIVSGTSTMNAIPDTFVRFLLRR